MTDILNQFPDEELPVSTVDIPRAVRAGRRRRRGLSMLAAGVTVVAVVAGVATAAVLLTPRHDAVPPAQPQCGSPAPSRPAQPTWQSFDPLLSEIDASGVDGYRVTTIATSTYMQVLQLDGGGDVVAVVLYACGGEPRSLVDETVPIDPAAGDPTDPIDGASAYWLPDSETAHQAALAWQWTTGAWAIVVRVQAEDTEPLPAQDEQRSLARQVAEQLEFGAGTPVRSPFSVRTPEGMYPSLTLTSLSSDNGRELPVSFNLGFNLNGTEPPSYVAGDVPDLWVNANAFAAVDDLPSYATPYPEDLGYPAYQSDFRNEGRPNVDVLLVFDFFGFGMELEPRGIPGTRQEKLAFAADVFRTVTVYPGSPVTDRSAWGDPIAP